MKMFFMITVAAAMLAATASHAAEIPAKYHGVYAPGESCAELPASERDMGEFPWMIVTKKAVHGHETLCEIIAVQPNVKGKSDRLTMACSADGDEKPGRVTQTWSIQMETKSIWGFKISQPYLSQGEARFKKCALQAVSTRD